MTSNIPASEVLARGEMVGEYRVVGRHAVGGMGAVYEATHPLIGKRVAIKVIHGRLSQNVIAVQRFVDEARAVNRIGHPNIVDIFAFGTLADGRCYFVMEWLEGESLHQRMMRGYLGARETLEVLQQLTDALSAAHAAGVIHRDLKPANVHLVKRGATEAVKLLDFGIAKLSEKEAISTALGTPEYISPEQAQGGNVDASTDVYSLGAMAFALFLGRLPFIGADARFVIDAQISQPVPNPIALWPNIPPSIVTLVLSMLSKIPSERPSLQTIREELDLLMMAKALNDAVPEAKLSKSRRPILVRSYDRFGALARAMMDDLSGGVAVAKAMGEAPAPGTPVLVRHQVGSWGAAVDFPALSEGRVVRYDRVPKDELGRILAVISPLGDADPEGREEPSVWTMGPPGERWTSDVPPEWAKRARAKKKPIPDRPTEIIPSRIDGRVPEPPEVDALASADTVPSEPRKERAPGLGLTAKVLILIGFVTIGSVGAVMWLALVNIKNDRSFYFEDLSLRTSLHLADAVRARSGSVPAKEIVDAQHLPPFLSAWVIDREGAVIAEVGPKKTRRAVSLLDRSNPGSKRFVDEDGEEMVGAWSGGSDVAVVVAVPMSVSAEAVEILRDQLGFAAGGVLLVAGALAFLFAGRLTRRLRLLATETTKIGRGEFTGVAIAEGQDEVGQLARSFLDMADALRERDEEVRQIQKRMGQAEARAVQRQLAESLETQLAPTLESMRGLLDRELAQDAPQDDFRQRQVRLRYLHDRASSAVNRALALTSIVSRRVDFASAVSEAIAYVRKKLGAAAPQVKLFAANAVLFPRLDVGESELREIVSTMIERWVAAKGSSAPIEIQLSHRGSELLLAIRYPHAPGGRKVVAEALSEIERLVLDASASAAVREEAERARVVIAFAVDLEAEERPS